MKRVLSGGWLLLGCWFVPSVGLPPAQAGEVVSYTPGSPFILNSTTGNPNENFGTVTVQSDSATGWVLKVRSATQSHLKHLGSNYRIQYSLTVDGSSVDVSSGTDAIAKAVSTPTCLPPTGCSLPMQGTISPLEIDGKPAGRYSDTLIFTLINQ